MVPQGIWQGQRGIHAAGLLWISCLAAHDSGALGSARAFRRRSWSGAPLRTRGGPESLEKTPEGTPFNVGVWVGPDGESVLAGSTRAAITAASTPISANLCHPRTAESRARRSAEKDCSRCSRNSAAGAKRSAVRSERYSGIRRPAQPEQDALTKCQQDHDHGALSGRLGRARREQRKSQWRVTPIITIMAPATLAELRMKNP